MDLETGVSRELASGWGVVRQIAWSPDGSQILVIGGRETISHHSQLNPLVNPLPASLFLVDVDDSEVHEIATGHYVAAAWSPDGSRIAAIDYPGERTVEVLRADGSGKPLPLADLPGNDLFTGVVWNPAPAR
jgi:Tol biopolymer transport system component